MNTLENFKLADRQTMMNIRILVVCLIVLTAVLVITATTIG